MYYNYKIFAGYFEFKDSKIQLGPKVERNEWGDLILHYWPILLIVLVVGILVASMPIIGYLIAKKLYVEFKMVFIYYIL